MTEYWLYNNNKNNNSPNNNDNSSKQTHGWGKIETKKINVNWNKCNATAHQSSNLGV